jgi:iron only hydrogenase large subunit-like protein
VENNCHSVRLKKNICTGCTNCLKQCPTQAIRIQNGKAKILSERCIDCGECIRVCPQHAKQAVTDGIEIIEPFKYKVALVAPAFCGQFSKSDQIDLMLSSLKKIGFDDVYEVARGAEVISKKTRELLDSGELLMPSISSACPAVVKLIAIRFPNLIGNIIPLKSPMEVSAEMARREAAEKTGLSGDEIGIFFISPCAAKATVVKYGSTVEKSQVDGVIAMKDIYLKMAHTISKLPETEIEKINKAGAEGILWATAGGEARATRVDRRVSVDGIHDVIRVLEAIEDGKLGDIEYVEALACTGGCVGGPLVAENNFVANSRIKRISKTLPENFEEADSSINTFWEHPVVYRSVMNLDNDIHKAMEKIVELEKIYERLPKLDCGSCGSPSCRDLAEDIVRGFADEIDCVFILRERISALAREMVELDKNSKKNLKDK